MTATITRTDIHRPSAAEFDPEAYDLVGVFDLDATRGISTDDPDALGMADMVAEREGERFDVAVGEAIEAGAAWAAHQDQSGRHCGHCGAAIRYAALVEQREARELITVGETCLGNRFEALTAAQFQSLRKAALLNRERVAAIETRRHSLLLAEQLVMDFHPALMDLFYVANYPHLPYFLEDIASKLRRDGKLSERQLEAALRVLTESHAKANERAAEDAAATDAPSGKVTITGTVKSTRWDSNPYGPGGSVKGLVIDDRGFKVWTTIPAAIVFDVDKGTRISFTATLTVSDDDPTFAFAKRPTKASIVGA